MFEKFVEVPNTNIQEPVLASQFADELCLSISEVMVTQKSYPMPLTEQG